MIGTLTSHRAKRLHRDRRGVVLGILGAVAGLDAQDAASSSSSSSSVAAQAPEGSIVGRVIGSDGKSIPGAIVKFIHRPIPSCVDSPAIRREAVTDARGMFRAKAPADRRFSSWATWAGGATTIEEGVTTGSFVTMRAGGSSGPREIEIVGAAAWAEFAPLAYRVLVGSENVEFRTVVAKSGVLSVPRLPAIGHPMLEVHASHGGLLWVAEIGRRSKVVLPPLVDVRVRVVGRDGQPIAGAEVFRHIRNYWFTESPAIRAANRFRILWPRVGVTDGRGAWRGRLPQPGQASGRPTMHLLARAKGSVAALSGWHDGKRYGNGALDDRQSGSLQFVLDKHVSRPGRIRIGGANYTGPVSLVWRIRIDFLGLGLPFREPVLRAANGVLDYPMLRPRSGLEQALVALPSSIRDRIETQVGVRPPIAAAVLTPETLVSGAGAVDPYAKGGVRPIQAVLPDGRPAARAVVLFATSQAGEPHAGGIRLVRADRVGRAIVPVSKLGSYVAVATPEGWVGRAVPPDTGRAAGRQLLRLDLLRTSFVEGRVVNGRGEPVAGLFVGPRRFRWSVRANVEGTMPVSMMGHAVHSLGEVATDADGRFRAPIIPSMGEVALSVQESATSPPSALVWVSCDPEAKPEPIVLTVDRR